MRPAKNHSWFARFSRQVSRAAGQPAAFAVAVLLIAGWLGAGPLFGFSNTWQLVINTGTPIVTFLMVFLIQNTQSVFVVADVKRRAASARRGNDKRAGAPD